MKYNFPGSKLCAYCDVKLGSSPTRGSSQRSILTDPLSLSLYRLSHSSHHSFIDISDAYYFSPRNWLSRMRRALFLFFVQYSIFNALLFKSMHVYNSFSSPFDFVRAVFLKLLTINLWRTATFFIGQLQKLANFGNLSKSHVRRCNLECVLINKFLEVNTC